MAKAHLIFLRWAFAYLKITLYGFFCRIQTIFLIYPGNDWSSQPIEHE